MNTPPLFSRTSEILLVGLALVFGAETGDKAVSGTPRSTTPRITSKGSEAVELTAVPAQAGPAPKEGSQGNVHLSAETLEILKMSQAGLEEEIIEAYVRKSQTVKPPSADEIIYLWENGVSLGVITAYISRGEDLRTPVTPTNKTSQITESKPATPAPSTPPVPVPVTVVIAPTPAPVVNYPNPSLPYSGGSSYIYAQPYYFGSYGYSYVPSAGYNFTRPRRAAPTILPQVQFIRQNSPWSSPYAYSSGFRGSSGSRTPAFPNNTYGIQGSWGGGTPPPRH